MILQRKKKIVLLAHCFLNINAKVKGLATEEAGCKEIVSALLDNGFAIIQLPCVENICFGLNRWGQVKEQVDFPGFRARCRDLLQPVLEQLINYEQNGYRIAAVIGVDGSPSCGVNYTSSANWGGEIGDAWAIPARIGSPFALREAGVMMEVLKQMLKEAGMEVRFLAVDEKEPQASVAELISELI